jgi:Type III restriction enzyme, res subunit/Helicase conserved C-terminal domain
MNHLEQLKQQLMVKPNVQEREKVTVIINVDKNKKKPKVLSTQKKTEKDKFEFDKEEEKDKDKEENTKDKEEVDEEEKEGDKIIPVPPIIVDKTQLGYDRNALFKKLAESKKSKVTVKETVLKEVKEPEPIPAPVTKKAKKIDIKKPLIIEEDEEEVKQEEIKPEEGKKVGFKETAEIIEQPKDELSEEFIMKPKKLAEKEPTEIIPVKVPKEKKRKTEKPEKGIAVLGPEVIVELGDTELTKRLPKRSPPINIKVASYIMNNREIFVNFINSLFEPYKKELESNKENISCDTIGKTSTDFSLLTHQKIVRDYMNLYTPYRGLLLYHGLGSGKTCTSIAIAEGMKDSKNVIIMTPASLRANYIGELKKCGDSLYKKNQYWEWISVDQNPEALKPMSAILNLPQEYIRRHGGAFFVNVKKPSNYDKLNNTNKQVLEEQLNEMIRQKYTFINYNGLREKRLEEMSAGFTKNIFDNAVIIIDEAHNFISRIVNKLKKEKPISESKRGEKEHLPLNLATKLYEMLLSAKNARVVLLSGTPIINYPNEFGILFNILRGYIKTWKIPLVINTNKKIDRIALQEILLGEKSMDYLDYSPSSKILTITRNPFGFKNKIKKESGYQGVSNTKKSESKDTVFDTDFVSDDDFERKIISTLRRNDIDIIPDGIEIRYRKALPDTFDEFVNRYVDETNRKLKNSDALKRRIIGLSSYFRSAQESLLPKFNKQLGQDYHILRIPMSDLQFKIYEAARKEERKLETKKPKNNVADDYEDKASTYRIFSRLACNFVIPDRPIPIKAKKKDEDKDKDKDKDKEEQDETGIISALKEGKKVESKQDVEDEREGEIEGDEVLNTLGGTTYMERLQDKIKEMEEHSNDYFTPEELEKYSPKFLHILENIQDEEYSGLHLVYSQFRTAEGIGLFTLVLNKNGFTQFKIKKNSLGLWEISIPEVDQGKPTYALYTGTETVEEKEIIRKIYNGEWDDIPDSIGNVLKQKYRNNNMGEVIKVFMITSSGSEGINLRNTRYVHLMDPYWHPVRSEQVIGRARRICSHKDLPQALQTVEVFVYLMIFSEAQLKSDQAIELKKKDLSKAVPKTPFTSDQYLFEISEIKANLTNQMTEAIKESAFDCYIYSNGKCINFGDPTIDKFSYVPDFADQQNDVIVQANKQAIEWKGKPITINGVDYVYRRINADKLNIYDKKTYEDALKDPSIIPLQIGTLEKNERGENVFKSLVTK